MGGDKRLDVLHAYAGPCAFCGAPDKRHRLADSVDCSGRIDGIEHAMDDFSLTREQVVAVMAAYATARRQHRKLPGR